MRSSTFAADNMYVNRGPIDFEDSTILATELTLESANPNAGATYFSASPCLPAALGRRAGRSDRGRD